MSDQDGDHFSVYWYKDMCVFAFFVVVVGCAIYSIGDCGHHADNDLRVARFATPEHIVPEWYFLPFYSMLRSSSSKFLGVVLLFGGLGVLAVLTANVSHLCLSGLCFSDGFHGSSLL